VIKIKLQTKNLTLSAEEQSVRKVLAEWQEIMNTAVITEGVLYKQGMKDNQPNGPIAQLQMKLIKLKFMKKASLGVDQKYLGTYGLLTKRAVRNFQKKAFPNKRDEWDGQAGKRTLDALGGKVPPATGSRTRAPSTRQSSRLAKRKAGTKKSKYFKGKKRPNISFIKKAPSSSKMTTLKQIAMGKLGVSGQLKAGGKGREVEALKRWLVSAKLFEGNDLSAVYGSGNGAMTLNLYDEHTINAVKRYQERLSLEVTGKISQETAIALMLGIQQVRLPKKSKTPLRFSEEPKQAKQTKNIIYTKIFGVPNPSKFAVASILKNKTDMVDRSYQLALRNAVTNKDELYSYMSKGFATAVKNQGGKGGAEFYGYFAGLARKTIKEKGWTVWDTKFKEFALNPIMLRVMSGNNIDSEKVRYLVSSIFDIDTLNAQMFASKMKSNKTEFTKKEQKVIRYLGGENSYLAFNLRKTELSWVLACGRKNSGSGKCKALKERNINNLSEMIHPSDLVLKKWRATSGHLDVYKNIKGKINKDIEKLINQRELYKLKNQSNWTQINRILQVFKEIGKGQNKDIRQARDMGPLPIGVYRVSDYQEKSHKSFEGHFSRNMSTKVSEQWKIIKSQKERNLLIKLMKKFNFVPSRARDSKSTVGADGKRYRGRRPTTWNVSSLTSAAYAWGRQRMWLTKLNVPDPKARKRSGFSIHGGAAFGSSGCIDLGPAMGNFSSFYKKAVGKSDILLISTAGNLPNRVSKKYYLGKEVGSNVEGASV
jgi:peptidoglycan hydrolase-like protein with peptidoglycan-binding domain